MHSSGTFSPPHADHLPATLASTSASTSASSSWSLHHPLWNFFPRRDTRHSQGQSIQSQVLMQFEALPQFAIYAAQALVEVRALLKFSCTLRGLHIFSLRAGEPVAVPAVEYTSLVGRLFPGGPALL